MHKVSVFLKTLFHSRFFFLFVFLYFILLLFHVKNKRFLVNFSRRNHLFSGVDMLYGRLIRNRDVFSVELVTEEKKSTTQKNSSSSFGIEKGMKEAKKKKMMRKSRYYATWEHLYTIYVDTCTYTFYILTTSHRVRN